MEDLTNLKYENGKQVSCSLHQLSCDYICLHATCQEQFLCQKCVSIHYKTHKKYIIQITILDNIDKEEEFITYINSLPPELKIEFTQLKDYVNTETNQIYNELNSKLDKIIDNKRADMQINLQHQLKSEEIIAQIDSQLLKIEQLELSKQKKPEDLKSKLDILAEQYYKFQNVTRSNCTQIIENPNLLYKKKNFQVNSTQQKVFEQQFSKLLDNELNSQKIIDGIGLKEVLSKNLIDKAEKQEL